MATFDKADPKALVQGLADAGRAGTELQLAVAARANGAAQLLANVAERELRRAKESKLPKDRLAALKSRLQAARTAAAATQAGEEQVRHQAKAGVPLFGVTPQVTGRVVDAKGNLVPGATATLSGDDGKLLAQSKADDAGYFRLKIPPGTSGGLRLWVGESAERPLWETKLGREQWSLPSTFHTVTVKTRG